MTVCRSPVLGATSPQGSCCLWISFSPQSWKYSFVLKRETRMEQTVLIVWKESLGCIYVLLTKCEVKMVGYWPSYFFFACLWTEAEANIQTRPVSSHLGRTSLVNKGNLLPRGINDITRLAMLVNVLLTILHTGL